MKNSRLLNWRSTDGQLPLGGAQALVERTFRQGDIPSLRRCAVEFGVRAGMRSVRLSDFVLAVSEAAACTVAGRAVHGQAPAVDDRPPGLLRGARRQPVPSRARAATMRPSGCGVGCSTGSAITRRVEAGPDGVTRAGVARRQLTFLAWSGSDASAALVSG